jgi:TctA family transporter
MLFMFHLLVGLLIGLGAFWFLKDREVVLLAVIGSVLPDLIDKPLGYILLSVDYGRIYAHTGLFMLSVLFVGILYRQRKGSWIILMFAVGIIFHLILDEIWEYPVTLFYPFLGDFNMPPNLDFIQGSIVNELGNPFEWIFGISAIAMLLYFYRKRLFPKSKRSRQT